MVRDSYLNTLPHCHSGPSLATSTLSSPIINMKVKIIMSSNSGSILIEKLCSIMAKNTGVSRGV